MPGVVQYGVNNIEECLKPIVNKGLKSVLLFAVEHGIPKVGDYHYFKVETFMLLKPKFVSD
jgi:delta-aminolevulinic acid dehydratase/porphobilinogen synthase